MTANQTRVFEQIAIGNDGGHNPATVTSLINKGFVIRLIDRPVGRDVLGIISVPQYDVPIPIHYEWCQWCADNWDGFEPIATKSATTPKARREVKRAK